MSDERQVPSDSGQDSPARVSSPAATGGAGNTFEQQVVAHHLALLLVGGIPPVHTDCTVVEVHVQTEIQGWRTDDLLLIVRDANGHRRQLVGQVKRKFTVSTTNTECVDTICKMWRDFKNSDLFDPQVDRFVLVVQRGTNRLLHDLASLLETARAAQNPEEFQHRLSTPGYVTKNASNDASTLLEIVQSEDDSVSHVSGIHAFLSLIHILPLDLATSTSISEGYTKTLLANTSHEEPPVTASQSTWDALVRFAGEVMPTARRLTRTDLPEVVRQRHSSASQGEHRAIVWLREHTEVVLNGIHTSIGGVVSLPRPLLVQRVVNGLEQEGTVIISGPAGSGKSAVAKTALALVSTTTLAFSFRAEEFAKPHIDDVFHGAGINAATLRGLAAGQRRVVFHVESVERLLESSVRDAFADLLMVVAQQGTWQLVLTCRDYSLDLVRAALLEGASARSSTVSVPPLSDTELATIRAARPDLERPLSSPSLRELLRNPYYLSAAARVDWSDGMPLPDSERHFRRRFWRDIVRGGIPQTPGTGKLRAKALVSLAVQRARALTPYVDCSSLPPDIADGLRRDGLVTTLAMNDDLMAPAHDVLEDWALLIWLDRVFAQSGNNLGAVDKELGSFPALRRAYRRWASEKASEDLSLANTFLIEASTGGHLAKSFQDDTLVALLTSSNAELTLQGNVDLIESSGAELIVRLIQLTRVACVQVHAWGSGGTPRGSAWSSLAGIICDRLACFDAVHHKLLLRFATDWSTGVTWRTPHPHGEELFGRIAYWLLDNGDRSTRRSALEVIVRIPCADDARFERLARGETAGTRPDLEATRELRSLILEGMTGAHVAREKPDLLADLALSHLLLADSDLSKHRSWHDMGPCFGVRDDYQLSYFPASAFQGPFLTLIRFHTGKGLQLANAILNHSAEMYAKHYARHDLEATTPLRLTFRDGSHSTVDANERLWNLYRGTTVGPCMIQSVLMALELWLLDLAENEPSAIDGVLLSLLKVSKSASFTAVATSIAVAYPTLCRETVLVLLQSRLCVQLERGRYIKDLVGPPLDLGFEDRRYAFYYQERRASADRDHRKRGFESAVMTLQVSPARDDIWKILDAHYAGLPDTEKSESDLIWELTIRRMDLRDYDIGEPVQATHDNEGEEEAESKAETLIIPLEPKKLVGPLRDMTEDAASLGQRTNRSLGCEVWGRKAFDRDDCDSSEWRHWLAVAMEMWSDDSGPPSAPLGREGPGYIAAVCVRDHWDSMSITEQEWCAEVIVSTVVSEHWGHAASIQRGYSSQRPCASVLPALLQSGKGLDEEDTVVVKELTVVALTHANYEVRRFVGNGVGHYLADENEAFVLDCANLILGEARALISLLEAHRGSTGLDGYVGLRMQAAKKVRAEYFDGGVAQLVRWPEVDAASGPGGRALVALCEMLRHLPDRERSGETFKHASHSLTNWWSSSRRYGYEREIEWDHNTATLIERALCTYLLTTNEEQAQHALEPIKESLAENPREVGSFISSLILEEDRLSKPARFWSLWSTLADAALTVGWMDRVDGHFYGAELLSPLFLGRYWKDGARDWSSLNGYRDRLPNLLRKLPASRTAFGFYVRYLSKIGWSTLPGAFIVVSERVQVEGAWLLDDENTMFRLEQQLSHFVYGRPVDVKSSAGLRAAITSLLDCMVQQGSAAAFRMRDDFSTPLSGVS